MKVRGERECTSCGTQWSYYETGSVICPSCGSIRSVGLDDRTEHTAGPASLTLAEVRSLVDDVPTAELADDVESVCAEYVRRSGFIVAGELRELDDTYLAAQELRHVAAEVGRSMRVTDEEEYYFLDLLRGADEGERPLPTEVPESMYGARGLAVAAALDAYRTDLRRYLEDTSDATVVGLLGSLRDHQKRVEALDGEVSPRSAESLVRVARAVGRAVADDDESALVEARELLDGFDLET